MQKLILISTMVLAATAAQAGERSLTLGGGDNKDLTLRLKLSIVHLLGARLKSRHDGFQKVGKLYDVRSKIVHSGKYEVDKADSSLMRAFTLRCFARVLADKQFGKMGGKNDIDEWFAAQMRGDK